MIERIYTLLLRAFPARQRLRYGAEMLDAFRRERSGRARDRGVQNALPFVLVAYLDVVRSGWRERRRERRYGRGGLLAGVGHDIRHAVRSLRRSWTFTLICRISLAGGLIINAALVVLLRKTVGPPPGIEEDGAVDLLVTTRGRTLDDRWSYPDFRRQAYRAISIPPKRHQKKTIEFLCREEIEALVAAPDTSVWIGRRDRTILLVLVQTGLRVSELTSLLTTSVMLGAGAHVRCVGKGRKNRCTPLRRDVERAVTAWLDEQRPASEDPLFPNSRGGRLSTDAVQRLVTKYASVAAQACPSLAEKTVTPHVLRHSVAMALLQQGVDRSVIALWLGHESVETTQMYLHADLQLKERALARTASIEGEPGRYQPNDALLAFLETL